jgi:hypothetical protein
MAASPACANPRYLEITLNNQSVRRRLYSFRNHSIVDIFTVIEQAGKDKRIQGLLVICDEYPKPKFIETLILKGTVRAGFLTQAVQRAAGSGGLRSFTPAVHSETNDLDIPEDLRCRIFSNGRTMPILPLYMG